MNDLLSVVVDFSFESLSQGLIAADPYKFL
jgi:hypothetical protein